jgi:hypothetical protein
MSHPAVVETAVVEAMVKSTVVVIPKEEAAIIHRASELSHWAIGKFERRSASSSDF